MPTYTSAYLVFGSKISQELLENFIHEFFPEWSQEMIDEEYANDLSVGLPIPNTQYSLRVYHDKRNVMSCFVQLDAFEITDRHRYVTVTHPESGQIKDFQAFLHRCELGDFETYLVIDVV